VRRGSGAPTSSKSGHYRKTTCLARGNVYGFIVATLLLVILCCLTAPFLLANDDDPIAGGWGGGAPPTPTENCLTPAQAWVIQAQIVRNSARLGLRLEGGPGGTASYSFQPIAGNVWQDRFIQNFVDLDSSSSGILDWDCTDFTYDGHKGHDIGLRFFGEQDVGVPIFAALDGTVVATHDGEFDRNTSFDTNAVANYVVLDHGNGHRTYYAHMRKNSVAVNVGQIVNAGTQLGLGGSSGTSTGPHLHFESRLNGVVYEPYNGPCQQSSPSEWVNQTPIRRDMYLEMFAMHGTNKVSPSLPENPPRRGTFIRNGTFQSIGCWYRLHNQPANSTWRLRYLRPNGTVLFDSGTKNFNNTTNHHSASWWFYYNLNPDVTGTWSLEASVNGQVLLTAPFLVLDPGGVPANRPPNPFTASFDPPLPGANDVIFCRLSVPQLDDPDYDFVWYRYQWKVNGIVVRDSTNAALADAIPRSLTRTGDLLSCTVTALDGLTNGTPVTVMVFVGGTGPIGLAIKPIAGGNFFLSWSTSGPPYALEYSTNLGTLNGWQAWPNGIQQSGGQNVATNPVATNQRFFRLRFTP